MVLFHPLTAAIARPEQPPTLLLHRHFLPAQIVQAGDLAKSAIQPAQSAREENIVLPVHPAVHPAWRVHSLCPKLPPARIVWAESLQHLISPPRVRIASRELTGERAKRASLVTEECKAPCEIAVHGYIHY